MVTSPELAAYLWNYIKTGQDPDGIVAQIDAQQGGFIRWQRNRYAAGADTGGYDLDAAFAGFATQYSSALTISHPPAPAPVPAPAPSPAPAPAPVAPPPIDLNAYFTTYIRTGADPQGFLPQLKAAGSPLYQSLVYMRDSAAGGYQYSDQQIASSAQQAANAAMTIPAIASQAAPAPPSGDAVQGYTPPESGFTAVPIVDAGGNVIGERTVPIGSDTTTVHSGLEPAPGAPPNPPVIIPSPDGGSSGRTGPAPTPAPAPTEPPGAAPSTPPASPPPAPAPPKRDFIGEAHRLWPWIPAELLPVFASAWEQYGDPQLALAELRQSPLYDTYFAGNRRSDGTIRLTEPEYLATIEGYRQRFNSFGAGLSELFAPRFRELIEGNKSPDELQADLDRVFVGVVTNSAAVRAFYAQHYGANDLSDAALFASAISGLGSDPLIIERRIRAAQIGGEAATRGFARTTSDVERLASYGLDQQAARRLYGEAGKQLPTLGDLQQRFNDQNDPLSLTDFENALVLNDPLQLAHIARLYAESSSSFSPRALYGLGRRGELAGLSAQ